MNSTTLDVVVGVGGDDDGIWDGGGDGGGRGGGGGDDDGVRDGGGHGGEVEWRGICG